MYYLINNIIYRRITCYTEELPVTGFFAVMAIVFAMLLPACSLED
jgi:hypothetical protein